MKTLLKDWKGSVEFNGVLYDDISCLPLVEPGERIHLRLIPKVNPPQAENLKQGLLKITVKQYMTRPATPDFDFMEKWNNNIPMPLRIMVGEKIKETRGMVYMKLRGDITEERTCYCMKCGKKLTNPVSQYFGIGPECGGHNYVNPFNSEKELKDAVENYRKKLNNITWEGWIIKSAITDVEEI